MADLQRFLVRLNALLAEEGVGLRAEATIGDDLYVAVIAKDDPGHRAAMNLHETDREYVGYQFSARPDGGYERHYPGHGPCCRGQSLDEYYEALADRP